MEYNCYKFDSNLMNNLNTNEELNIEKKKFIFDRKFILKFIYNAMVTGFKEYIYFCTDNKGIYHYSVVTKKCNKYKFLKQNDVVIGSCWTREDKRGKSIYPRALNHIACEIKQIDAYANIYVLVRDENKASISGLKKSSFYFCGKVKKTQYFKIYSDIF